MKTPIFPYSKQAFSWTEILVIVTVLGFLAAVLIPLINRGHSGHGRTVASSNIRQIGQSALIYANDNGELLPGLSLNAAGEIVEGGVTPNIHALAAAMAREGGLNDGQIWFAPEDRNPDINRLHITTVLDSSRTSVSPEFATSAVSFQFIAGLTMGMPSVTPIAFTRGLQTDGRWANDRTTSVFGNEGGHIVFLGGNVSFHRDLIGPNNLIAHGSSSGRTENILETIDSSSRIFSEPATQTGAVDGKPGIAP